YSPQSLTADARRHGQVVLRPCVERSEVLARVERLATPFDTPADAREDLASLTHVDRTLAVRMGLTAVRGLGEDAAQAIVDARSEGPFVSLQDMARRVRVRPAGVSGQTGLAPEKGLSVAQWEALATAGALESLGVTRREAMWAPGALSREGPDTHPGVATGVKAPTLHGRDELVTAIADVCAPGVSADANPTDFVL